MHTIRDILPRKDQYKYEYSKDDKMSVYRVKGDRTKSVRIQSLKISARFLVLEVKTTSDFSVILILSDSSGNHFNISYSTAARRNPDRPGSSQTSALLSLPIPKDHWVAIFFDLKTIADQNWRPGAFKTLECIEISPTCVLSKVFAKDDPPVRGPDKEYVLPKGYSFPTVLKYTTVCVPEPEPSAETPQRKSRIPVKRISKSNSSASGARLTQSGTKIPVSAPESKSRKSLKSAPPREPEPEPEPEPTPETFEEEDEEEDSDDSAFDGAPPEPEPPEIQIETQLPDGEEEELELVHLEALGCYYCPSNQKYYQLDQ